MIDKEDVAWQALDQVRERNFLRETAEQAMRDRDFYQAIVAQIGEMFGDEAKTADDGTVVPDVLALKVPECVGKLRAERDCLSAELNVTSQNYLHSCECIANKDRMIAHRDEEIVRLRAEIEAARQEAFRYGFQRDCDDSDSAEVAQADELISLVSWIAQAECQARAERDDALCRLRELERRFVPYEGRGGVSNPVTTCAVPPEMFDGVAVIDRTESGHGAVVGRVTNARSDADGNVLADLVYEQDGHLRLVGNVWLRRGTPIGLSDVK